MMHKWILLLIPIFLFAQEKERSVVPLVPADRRVDVYAVYSALMAEPKLSHPDTSQKYLIAAETSEETAIFAKGPGECATIPPEHRARFREVLTDYEEHRRDHYRLEHSLAIAKPYSLVNRDEAERFRKSRSLPDLQDGADPFPGATDLITLGNVYFSQDRKLATVSMASWCGGLCGLWSWHFLLRQDDGHWKDQNWQSCFAVASRYASRREANKPKNARRVP